MREATVTITVFSLIVAVAFLGTRRLSAAYVRLARIAGLLAFVWVNFGFWVGSLFGDRPGFSWLKSDLIYGSDPNRSRLLRETREAAFHIPDAYFAGAWAVGLIALGIWAGSRNQRGLVNAVVVFASIHFYTQWFEHLNASPFSVIVGGALSIVIAFALWRYNQKARLPAPASAHSTGTV